MLTIEHWPPERLIEYARNPRRNDHAVAAVAAAIHEYGFRVPILARSDGLVIDGHLRLKAARQLGLETVPVLLADDLSETQVKAFRLSVNKVAELAEWDEDLLRLELQDLTDLDFDLGLTGFDEEEMGRLLGGDNEREGDGSVDDTYSRKIVSPVYEPKGDKPPISELYDESKTRELIQAIDRSRVPDDISCFLKAAAQRHTVFHFARIADFYAHSSAEVQALMEESALVIIDFKKAIEFGFVRLTERLGEIADIEGWNDAG